MNAIKEALERLNGSINTLDQITTEKLQNLQTDSPQRDMFSAVPAQASNQNNQEAITSRLDNAIETVEKLLEEA